MISTMSAVKPSILRFEVTDFERRFNQIKQENSNDVIFSDDDVSDYQGNKWRLRLKPGFQFSEGDDDEDDEFYDIVWISLMNVGEKDAAAEAHFVLRDSLGKVLREIRIGHNTTDHGDETCHLFMYRADRECFASGEISQTELFDKKRNLLVNGSLLIDGVLQFRPKPNSLHVPINPFVKNALKFLSSEEGADVSFKVGDAIIPAHDLILKMNAPILSSFCEGNASGDPIVIDDMEPETFRAVLHCVYGGGAPEWEREAFLNKGKGLIDAADRFGIVDLKLAVEAALVQCIRFTVSNATGWLVFADAKTCPLLKEYAMAYVVARARDCLQSEWSQQLKQSTKLLAEIVLEISESANNDRRLSGNERNVTVDELRKMLDKKGLDVDGSREMLISRLAESDETQGTIRTQGSF